MNRNVLLRLSLAVAFVTLLAAHAAPAGEPTALEIRRPRGPVARGAVDATVRVPPPALRGAIVTDFDPRALLAPEAPPFAGSLDLGPFDAHETVDLFVVTVYDRRAVGDEPFDQHTRFVLPDGSQYLLRIMPVDPLAAPGERVLRADLGPLPADVQALPRLRRLARRMPAELLDPRDARHATFTVLPLPVAGTWITRHNLYGTWQAEVSIVRDGRVIAETRAEFEIELTNR